MMTSARTFTSKTASTIPITLIIVSDLNILSLFHLFFHLITTHLRSLLISSLFMADHFVYFTILLLIYSNHHPYGVKEKKRFN